MNRPSIIQLYRTSLRSIFEKPEVPNLDFKLVALPFLALQRKELFSNKTRSEQKKMHNFKTL